ncbi:MAG: chemotaxis protein CheX [Verrucomicrobiota bacterium]
MSLSESKFDLSESVLRVVPHVLRTMLNLEVTPAKTAISREVDRISAIIGIGGDAIRGMFYFHLPVSFAQVIAANLFAESSENPVSDRQINDAVGELCNMVAGGLKAALADLGHDAGISPPSIIRGKSFSIESEPDLEITHFPFACGQDVLDLEVHLKLEL